MRGRGAAITKRASAAALLGCCAVLLVGVSAQGGPQLSGVKPDWSFGGTGTIYTPTGPRNPPAGIAGVRVIEDTHGRLVSVGGDQDAFVVTRYLRNGRLDRTFGDGGTARVGELDETGVGGRRHAAATAVTIGADGRILLAGIWIRDSQFPMGQSEQKWAVARLRPNGVLDPSFREDGKDVLNNDHSSGREVFDVELRPGGGFLVSGYGLKTGSSGFYEGQIVAFDAGGKLDEAFGSDGDGTVAFVPARDRTTASINDIEILPSGKILASGYFGFKPMVARLNRNGSMDQKFGSRKTPGMSVLDVAGRGPCKCAIGWGIDRDRRGRIVMTGYVNIEVPEPEYYIYLLRFGADGRIDRSFGTQGRVRTKFGVLAQAQHVAIQRDGRIVVAGRTGPPGRHRAILARYLPSGRLDTSFFADGKLIRKVGVSSEYRDVIIDSKGRLVASGLAIKSQKNKGFLLSRFLVR